MSKIRNPEITKRKLLDALQRLVDGQPQKVKDTYKINVKSVQEEAGLSLGAAYRYPDVMDAIEAEKQKQANRQLKNKRKRNTSSELQRLKHEKSKEVILKDKYRKELDEAKCLLDELYAEQNMQLMAIFNLLDIEDRTKLLKSSSDNVISINDPF